MGVGGEAQRAGELPLPVVEVACTSSGGQAGLVQTVSPNVMLTPMSLAHKSLEKNMASPYAMFTATSLAQSLSFDINFYCFSKYTASHILA